MAYYGLGIYVGTTGSTTSQVTNWSLIKPTYFTYTGNNSTLSLTNSKWGSQLYTDNDGRKYAVYIFSDNDTEVDWIQNVGSQCWLHNDDHNINPGNYITNVSDLGYVYTYEQDTPFTHITIDSIHIDVIWHFDSFWNVWRTYGDRNYVIYNRLTQPARTSIDISSCKQCSTILVELEHDPNTYSGNAAVRIVRDNLGTYDYSTVAAYGDYIYDFKRKSKTVSSNRAQTTSTYQQNVFAIHNVGKNNYGHYIMYNGNVTDNNVSMNPATGRYKFSYVGNYNTWASHVSGTSTYYAITIDKTSLFVLQEIEVKLGKTYTFNLYTNGQTNYDGVVISKTSLSANYSSTFSSLYSSNTNVLGYLSGYNTKTSFTYTPLENGTLYMYYRSSTNNIYFNSASSTTPYATSIANVEVVEGESSPVTVTLNSNDATTNGTTSVLIVPGTPADQYPEITKPTKTGYTFLGYFDDITAGTAYYNSNGFGTRVFDKISDCTLYAHWQQNSAPLITVTLNQNGGEGGQSSVNIPSGASAGQYPTVINPSRSGYKFLGYYDDVSSGTQYYNSSGSGVRTFDKTSACTFYARWENNISYIYGKTLSTTYSTSAHTIQVAYISGCTAGTPQYQANIPGVSGVSISSDGKFVTLPSSLSPGQYMLYIQATSPSLTGANGYVGTTKYYNISLNIEKADPSFSLQGQTVSSGTAYVKARASVTGTVYWGTSSSAMDSTVSITTPSTSTYNVTITSRNTVGTTTVYAYFIPTDTANYNSAGDSSNYADSKSATVESNTNKVITLDDNGGFGGDGSILVAANTYASGWPSPAVTIPTRHGFTFLGYYDTNASSGGTKYITDAGEGNTTSPSTDTTLYARWKVNITPPPYSSDWIYLYCSNIGEVCSSTPRPIDINICDTGVVCVVPDITMTEIRQGWPVSSNGMIITVPSGTASGYFNLRVEFSVADGMYNGYSFVGNTVQSEPSYVRLNNVTLPSQKYMDTNGTEGTNVIADNPTVTVGSGLTAGISIGQITCTSNNITTWYQRYSNGVYTDLQYGTSSSTAYWMLTSQTFTPAGGGSATSITRFATQTGGTVSIVVDGVTCTAYVSGRNLSHATMERNEGTDTAIITAYNSGDTTKRTAISIDLVNELLPQHYKNSSCTTTGDNITYGRPDSVSISTGLTAAGGSATVSYSPSTVNNTLEYYQKYTSGAASTKQTSTSAATMVTSISEQTFTPTGGSASTTNRFSLSGMTVSHSNMGTNEGTDKVTVKVANADSTSTYRTGYRTVTNSITWDNPTVTYSGSTSFGASGGTITLSSSNISITQSGSYTSGSAASNNTTISALDFSQSTSATGFTYEKTGSSPIYSATNTAGNNTTTSSRTGNTITITATGNGSKSGTTSVSFSQSAGAIVYDAPVVSAFTYSTSVSAAGVTDLSPATLTCTRTYTWNGVSGSGNTETITSGITWAFTNSGASSYVTNGTDFATTGKINVATRGTTVDNERSFYTSISVIATVDGVSSVSKQATAGAQNGNYVVSIVPRATSGSKHFKYNNIGPGDTSASPTLTGGATYTFSSGSTSTSAPSGIHGFPDAA